MGPIQEARRRQEYLQVSYAWYRRGTPKSSILSLLRKT